MSRVANRTVELVLRSPAHRALSRKIQLIRYRGRRTGVERTTPTQYVELDATHVAIVVGHPEAKRWWRNFVDPAPLDLLIRGTWVRTSAQAWWRHDDPDRVDAALDAFAAKYGPRSVAELRAGADCLVVRCTSDGSTDPDRP